MKKCLALVLSILVAISCTGCTGAKQLSERLIIQGIGIDREDEGGYCLTLMYLDTESSTEEETVKVLMAKGKSVMDAMANSISQTGKEPLYSQNLFLLLGMKTAQTGFEEALSFFTTYYEARPNVNVFVCENKAEALLTAEEITPQQIDTISQSERKAAGRSYPRSCRWNQTVSAGIYHRKPPCLHSTGKSQEQREQPFLQRTAMCFRLRLRSRLARC